MFILDEPFVSDFLARSVSDHRIPVLKTEFATSSVNGMPVNFMDPAVFIDAFRKDLPPLLYTNSENAIGWISRNLEFTDLPSKIKLFKDKVLFRDLLRSMDPGFRYRELSLDELDAFNPAGHQYPFVIKPAVGFFSLGVYKVAAEEDWAGVLANIHRDVDAIKHVYPSEVLDVNRYIIEQHIDGDEFAFDAYFDREGKPVILGLLRHLFSSSADVSDRVYISSAGIYEQYLQPFTRFLEELGSLAGLRNFPLHVEVRVDGNGRPRPIEINPLRFGGWCTTADMTWYAYGVNSYEAVARQKAPDWENVLKGKEDKIYSNIVLTNSTGYDARDIRSFDYESLESKFENPLLLRKADFREFLIFGFVFAETSASNKAEIDWILNDDLREFITLV